MSEAPISGATAGSSAGTSFAEHVLGRRLEECRATLESPSSRGRSVTDNAYDWGFNSLASFYRAFRKRFDVSPGTVRRG